MTEHISKTTEFPYSISPKEAKVREYWLMAMIVSIPLQSIDFFIKQLKSAPGEEVAAFFGAFVSTVIVMGTYFGLMYHFIYKRHKTGWLTFSLFTIAIFGISTFFALFKFDSDFYWHILDLSVISIWYFLTLKMRYVNKKVQLQEMLSFTEYSELITSIETAESIDKLITLWNDGVENWPNHYPVVISPFYKKRLKELRESTT